MMQRNGRIAFLVVLGVIVIGALQVGPRVNPNRNAAGAAVAMPSTTAEGVESSAWYCAAAVDAGTDPADAEIIITNAGDEELRAVVRAMPSTLDQPRLVNVLRGETRVALADLVTEETSSVLVEVFGGDATVSHRIGDSVDTAQTPCASEASTTWWIPYVTTEKGADAQLILMNPFAEDAGVSVEIHTRAGRRFPAGFDNVTVPRFSAVSIPLHEPVQREHVFGVAVTAHRGRVVAEQLIQLDGAGISTFLGFNRLAKGWDFVGDVPGAETTFLSVYNPSDKVQEATVAVTNADGELLYEEDTILRAHAPTVVGISDAVEAGVPYRVAVRGVDNAQLAAAMIARTGGEVTDIPYSEVTADDEASSETDESTPVDVGDADGAVTTTTASVEASTTTSESGASTTTDAQAAAAVSSLFAPGGVSLRIGGIAPYRAQAQEDPTTTTQAEEPANAADPPADDQADAEPSGEDAQDAEGADVPADVAPTGTVVFETIRPAASASTRWIAASILVEGSPSDEVLVGNPGDRPVLVEMRGFAGGVNTDLASRLSIPAHGFAIVAVTSANAMVEVRAEASVTVARRVLGQRTVVSPAVGFR